MADEPRFNLLHHDAMGELVQCGTCTAGEVLHLLQGQTEASWVTFKDAIRPGDEIIISVAPQRPPQPEPPEDA